MTISITVAYKAEINFQISADTNATVKKLRMLIAASPETHFDIFSSHALVLQERQEYLRDSRTLDSYGIKDGSTVALKPLGLKGGMQIYARTLTGKTVSLEVESSDTIEEVKKHFERKTGVPIEQFTLIAKGRRLLDVGRTCADYNIVRDESIIVWTRLTGGGAGVLFSDMENPDTREFGEAPEWRVIHPGLNLSGTCINADCPALNDAVTVPVQMGTFEIEEVSSTACCVMCEALLENVTSCFFYHCDYKWSGKRDRSLELTESKWQQAPSDRYIAFDKDSKSLVKWSYLTIETRPHSLQRVLP